MPTENVINVFKQEPSRRFPFWGFCEYFWRRSAAFLIDLLICSILLVVLTLDPSSIQWEMSIWGIVMFWSISESFLGTSPGKWLAGLYIASDFTGWKAFVSLNVRAGLFICSWCFAWLTLSKLTQPIAHHLFYYPSDFIVVFGVPALFVLLQPFAWSGTTRLNHDLFSQVKRVPQPKMKWVAPTIGSIIILLGVIGIMLPNFIGCGHGSRSPISSVKANMHTMQTMVETYAVDWGGVYPNSIAMLHKEATNSLNPYWKDFENPFSSQSGRALSYMDMGQQVVPGAVVYLAVPDPDTGNIIGYKIYGYDKAGKLIQDKDQDFALVNY